MPSVTESVSDGSFIGVGCNTRVSKHGSTYHCEVCLVTEDISNNSFIGAKMQI